jgi:hypothetical protein
MSSTLLTEGANGTLPSSGNSGLANRYNENFDLLRTSKWNTFAILEIDVTIQDNIIAFIKEIHEDED